MDTPGIAGFMPIQTIQKQEENSLDDGLKPIEHFP
jgi:hypothetical protein